VRVDGTGSAVERTISVPGTKTIDLPQGNWVVSIHSLLFSSLPAVVAPGEAAAIDLFPAGTLRGSVRTKVRGTAVRDLRVSFMRAAECPDLDARSGDADCSLDDDRWSGLVTPAGEQQEPWHVNLSRQVTGQTEDPIAAVAASDGTWSGEVLPGHYFLQVGRDDDSVWSAKEFDVDIGDVTLNVSIRTATVTGIVKLGDRPLANARLIFGGEQGHEQQTLFTNDDGLFEGELPAKDELEKSWTISIQTEAPSRPANGGLLPVAER
jgi:hypothetical protein